ncbi:uncharacterized protein LOC113519466 [Galleria mellonella]|uniref:Uncharacterized protein LOC113519466 n=1 Tax=Galleria mellonella TaxID=7137 RepID=A0A6J1WVX3_GALME|nr:uncharacterized protein LOC113519466 [Galleria mellonella]
MKRLLFVFISVQVSLQTCPETTSVQIQNYDGPIFLHSPSPPYFCRPVPTYEKYELDCTCIKHPSYVPVSSSPVYNHGYYRDLPTVTDNSFCSVDNTRVTPCTPCTYTTSYTRSCDRDTGTLTSGLPQMGKYGNQNLQYECKCSGYM